MSPSQGCHIQLTEVKKKIHKSSHERKGYQHTDERVKVFPSNVISKKEAVMCKVMAKAVTENSARIQGHFYFQIFVRKT
jgi:hypothetical protein